MSEDNSKSVPKKRGRKPKNAIDTTNTIISVESGPTSVTGDLSSVVEPAVNPPPKKRGRKPKGGKIVENEPSTVGAPEAVMNVILHLKCSLKDLNANQNSYMEPYNQNMNTSFEPLVPDIKPGADFGSNYTVSTNQQPGDRHVSDNVCVEIKSEYDDNETKLIWKKLKQLEQNLNHNHTDNFKSDCFWCTCPFDNPPCFVPKCYIKDTYDVYGCFCTPECASAFLMNENIDSSAKFERYYLLNHIYGEIYSYAKNIKPAPSPFYMLNKYYGNMTIQEYRTLLSDERLFLIVDKPMTRIMPELHQSNDDHILSHKLIPSNQSTKQVKKSMTKNDALVEKFGLASK